MGLLYMPVGSRDASVVGEGGGEPRCWHDLNSSYVTSITVKSLKTVTQGAAKNLKYLRKVSWNLQLKCLIVLLY